MRSFLNKSILGAIALASISGTAFAQPLPPATALTPVDTGDFSSAGLFLLNDDLAGYTGVSNPEAISGTLASAVYGDAPTAAGSTTLTFLYQLTNSAGSTSAIDNFRLNGFAGAVITDAFEDNFDAADVAEVAGTSFAVSSGPASFQVQRTGGTGNTIIYNYNTLADGPFLEAGGTSRVLVLEIAGGTIDPLGNASVQGRDAVTANTTGTVFTPVAATVVPEANAGLLAGLALPLLGGIAILRRKKN